jgi:AAA15 family ATPase/GTPase
MKYFCILLLLSAIACSPEPTDQTKHYYDLKGFIDAQIKVLNQQKPTVNKQMTADGKTEQRQMIVSDWAKELELFRQLDLNKQAYILSYQTTRADSLTYLYTLKPTEKAPVRSLKIRLNKNSQVADIEAIVKTENSLYDSEKKLTLNCDTDKKRSWTIKNYSVKGHQHLTMTDKKAFEVVGSVLN